MYSLATEAKPSLKSGCQRGFFKKSFFIPFFRFHFIHFVSFNFQFYSFLSQERKVQEFRSCFKLIRILKSVL